MDWFLYDSDVVMTELKMYYWSHKILEKSNKQVLLIFCIFALLFPKMSHFVIIQTVLFNYLLMPTVSEKPDEVIYRKLQK